MMKVINEVKTYEVNGDKTVPHNEPRLLVKNHAYRPDTFVVLEIEGKTYTISARDLRAGTDNATNIPR